MTSIDAPPIATEETPSRINPLHAAGVVLLVNGVLGLLEMAVTLSSHAKGGFSSPVPHIIDLVVGFGLIQNKPNYQRWAIIRAAIGLVVFTGLHLSQGDPFTAVINAIYIGSLFLLLIGQPGKGRMWTGIAIAGLCLLLEVLGLAAMAFGFGGES